MNRFYLDNPARPVGRKYDSGTDFYPPSKGLNGHPKSLE